MRFVSTEVNIVHGNIENMRRKSIDIEDRLAEDFVIPFTQLPIPEDAPPEIPRLIGKSKQGHTEIQISKSSTKQIIRYDGDYLENWDICEKYIISKIDSIYKILDSIINKKYLFVGIITNMMIENENAKQFMVDKFINSENIERIEELSTRVAFINNDRFYTNIKLSSIKADIGDKKISQSKIVDAIGINLDVNDRYNINMKKGHQSSVDSAKAALEISSDIIKNKINAILENGVIKL
ncbi:MAG: hypothetical protein KAQ68_00755 [Clostridiales bacterium]|nr:hypothetical protein [Clostridiales bacterium]